MIAQVVRLPRRKEKTRRREVPFFWFIGEAIDELTRVGGLGLPETLEVRRDYSELPTCSLIFRCTDRVKGVRHSIGLSVVGVLPPSKVREGVFDAGRAGLTSDFILLLPTRPFSELAQGAVAKVISP